MRSARIALLLAVVSLAAALSGASSAASTAPTGLHGFMLRADETPTDVFHRTPSFGWDPYPGATGYQFQLSTSSTFRENAIIYNTNTLTTPVAAPSIALPWITGSPHSLYARVRATLDSGDVTPWSDDYGFDVVAPSAATPLPSDPGLLRWTPVEGATSYQVWLIDIPKQGQGPGTSKEHTKTNVLDERELYTFHQSTTWISSIRWRVRAVRSIAAGTASNGLPTTTYGPWSPIYKSSNPPLSTGIIRPLHTISDVTSDGSAASAAHRLMPAFTWTGNQTSNGTIAELFRVYVFTDKQCLNPVYTSAVVGSQAYAPRLGGPLQLPPDSAGITTARGAYLDDGAEPQGEMYDGTPVSATESQAAATPTTTPPADDGPAGSAMSGGSDGSASLSSSSGSSSGGSSAAVSAGAPVDLWDTDSWPKGGYYWVVVGVAPAAPTVAGTSTVAAPGASSKSTLVPVSDTTQFKPGESITIGVAPQSDTATIGAIGNGVITLNSPLNFGHAVGDPITTTNTASVVYQDLELPQQICADALNGINPWRVQRFGITSEPSRTSAQDPFATGLSPTGQLVSAVQNATFYGRPLVAWAPALSADTYEVEWSKTAYPFTAAGSLMTPATSAILPLSTGTWYYRVRGFDYNLPTGSQMLSWSDTEQIVIVPPSFKVTQVAVTKKRQFKVVGGASTKTSARKKTAGAAGASYDLGSFSLTMPPGWKRITVTGVPFAASTQSSGGYVTKLAVGQNSARGKLTFDQWKQFLVQEAQLQGAVGTIQSATVSEPAGTAVYLAFEAKNLQGAKGPLSTVVEYNFDAGAVSYRLAYVTLTSLEPQYRNAFTQIARSFRLH